MEAQPCDCHRRRQANSSQNTFSCFQPFLTEEARFAKLLDYVQDYLALHKLDQDKHATRE